MPGAPSSILLVTPDESGARKLSPTDISQFIRLDQCERYLRLRLQERSAGVRFMRDYAVTLQSIPPLLTRSGASFEEGITADIMRHYPAVNLATGVERTRDREHDNDRVVALAAGRVANWQQRAGRGFEKLYSCTAFKVLSRGRMGDQLVASRRRCGPVAVVENVAHGPHPAAAGVGEPRFPRRSLVGIVRDALAGQQAPVPGDRAYATSGRLIFRPRGKLVTNTE